MQIQVQNTKLGISTFWSMEKFQSNLAAMRELEQVRYILSIKSVCRFQSFLQTC